MTDPETCKLTLNLIEFSFELRRLLIKKVQAISKTLLTLLQRNA